MYSEDDFLLTWDTCRYICHVLCVLRLKISLLDTSDPVVSLIEGSGGVALSLVPDQSLVFTFHFPENPRNTRKIDKAEGKHDVLTQQRKDND